MSRNFQIAVVAIVATVAAGPAEALSQDLYAPLDHPVVVKQVPGTKIFYSIGSPGVPGKENQGNTSNAGFVVTDEGVVVFDALGTPSLGWALLQEIQKQTSNKIRFVIASHYHADHIYGLQVFKDHSRGEIVAQERAAEYTENRETADERSDQRLDQRRDALFPWVNKNTRVVEPDITFKERMTIALGANRLSLIYAGPAHSGSDIMMMVEPDGVLFAGDIVQNSRIPFMNSDDVITSQWLKALDEVLALDPKFIIPGHGEPSAAAKEAISFTRDYIVYVREAMGKAVESWTDFNTAYDQTDWTKYTTIPAFGNNNRGNAYRVYLELGIVPIQKVKEIGFNTINPTGRNANDEETEFFARRRGSTCEQWSGRRIHVWEFRGGNDLPAVRQRRTAAGEIPAEAADDRPDQPAAAARNPVRGLQRGRHHAERRVLRPLSSGRRAATTSIPINSRWRSRARSIKPLKLSLDGHQEAASRSNSSPSINAPATAAASPSRASPAANWPMARWAMRAGAACR